MRQEEELLKRASDQIKGLRQQNSIMGARLNMFDQCMQLVNVRNNTGGGDMCVSNDITYEIDRFIEFRDSENKKGTAGPEEMRAKVAQ